MSAITISTTERNKPLLMFNGYNYTVDKTTDEKTYWKCAHCRTIKCKGRIHTDVNNTTVLLENSDHNHPPSAVSNEVRSFEDKVRSRAVNTNESTQDVINNCLKNVSDQMVARIPDFKHIKRNIQRQRQKNDFPPIPHDKNFNTIPAELTTTMRHDKFLQFDSGPGDNRLIIFSSTDQLKILEDTEEVFIDGTFKVTPVIFYQLYTIHGVYRNNVFPLVFALLPDKYQRTYQRIINELVHICPLWNPKSIMVDFEKAAINAFQGSFVTSTNQATISGCFFHLQNSIQRKVQELGLKKAYENDSNFAYDVNKIAALAFLQPSEVSQGFDELYLSLPPILQPLMDYFEDTYIGRRRPNGRATPRFPIELWNMHQRTINHSMRTNNSAEAWHRRLNSVIQCQHPSLWIFIESIQKEENYIHCQIVKINAGQNSNPSKKYMDYGKRLKQLLLAPHPTVLKQLEGLARNL
ncbi:unnamed protein product [Didymodactylos carnosus]|uniref:MULE transposase domain-containing protein n=1 Tax=Didymodactylos carnosus TaxID=1234261 RepID=A0A8S2XCH9_9BILA|nr:unnamed protein product [Didymodactylos carnosus]CAF3808590.1 unnamed protein product [Didymodactylos carnosus]CAF4487984.1 unnamed protein product [Didymodactylos carnosus]